MKLKSIAALMTGSLAACTSIPPYPMNVPIPAETLLPPSAQLKAYTESEGLSLQMTRVTQHCGVVKQAMMRELVRRDNRTSSRRQGLVLTGSVAALVTTIYTGVRDKPKKEVIIPLGAIAGSALSAALPSLGKDERADALRERMANLRASETAAVEALSALEQGLLSLALLERTQEKASDNGGGIDDERAKKYGELSAIEDRFRAALIALSNECT